LNLSITTFGRSLCDLACKEVILLQREKGQASLFSFGIGVDDKVPIPESHSKGEREDSALLPKEPEKPKRDLWGIKQPVIFRPQPEQRSRSRGQRPQGQPMSLYRRTHTPLTESKKQLIASQPKIAKSLKEWTKTLAEYYRHQKNSYLGRSIFKLILGIWPNNSIKNSRPRSIL